MKLELDKMVFLFKGVNSKAYGQVPAQIVKPHKVNFSARRVTASFKTPNHTGAFADTHNKISYTFDRFIVCDKNDAAYILYGDNK